jgi:cytochrome c6
MRREVHGLMRFPEMLRSSRYFFSPAAKMHVETFAFSWYEVDICYSRCMQRIKVIMKRTVVFFLAATCICLLITGGWAKEDGKKSRGETLFQENCSPCHPDGGNIINPAFTLHKKDREAHGVMTAKDIMGKMRNPGPGMTKFDKETISDKDAKAIAEYIMKTFK